MTANNPPPYPYRTAGLSSREPNLLVQDMVRTLVAARIRQRISGRELARRLGVSYSLMANVELGRQSPTVNFLAVWAQALGYHLTLTPTTPPPTDAPAWTYTVAAYTTDGQPAGVTITPAGQALHLGGPPGCTCDATHPDHTGQQE